MSLFPYNYHKFTGHSHKHQGSPLDWEKAIEIAEQVYMWHHMEETSDWTESNDASIESIHDIALGLMTLLAEPAIINMLEAVGSQTGQVLTILTDRVHSGSETARARNWFPDLVKKLGLPIKWRQD